MFTRFHLVAVLTFCMVSFSFAQDEPMGTPAELDGLKDLVGVWDAEFEVWPAGPDQASITFKGVETNRPYGDYWIASDLDSTYQGRSVRVHSIVGYDLDKKKLVGNVIDDGPYAATMTGDYDEKTKTTSWVTHAKGLDGKPMVQKTTVTQKSAGERELVLMVPGAKGGEDVKFMQIRYVKRK